MTWFQIGRRLAKRDLRARARGGSDAAADAVAEAEAQGERWEAYQLFEVDKYGGWKTMGVFLWLPDAQRFAEVYDERTRAQLWVPEGGTRPEAVEWMAAHPNAATADEVLHAGSYPAPAWRSEANKRLDARTEPAERGGRGGEAAVLVEPRAGGRYGATVFTWPFVKPPSEDKSWQHFLDRLDGSGDLWFVDRTRPQATPEDAAEAAADLARDHAMSVAVIAEPDRPRQVFRDVDLPL
jgi:hypothetical protein